MQNKLTKTYLPVDKTLAIYERIFEHDYEYLLNTPEFEFPYERIGLDRLLAIIVDLKRLGIEAPAQVLDVGCNTGLFSFGLAALGYDVLGVENNIAENVQQWYPQPITKIVDTLQERMNQVNLEFIEADITKFIQETQRRFDVCLLLSVVHQWFQGYALSGVGELPSEEIERVLTSLFSQVDRVIYYEGPEQERAYYNPVLSLPTWFLNVGLVQRVSPIAISAAANGQLRTLYRLER